MLPRSRAPFPAPPGSGTEPRRSPRTRRPGHVCRRGTQFPGLWVESVRAAGDFAGFLPAEARPSARELRGLGVAVFVIRTVPRTDALRHAPPWSSRPENPLRSSSSNDDFMPLVFVPRKPETRPLSANVKADQLDSQGRAHIPANAGVLRATCLLDAGRRGNAG